MCWDVLGNGSKKVKSSIEAASSFLEYWGVPYVSHITRTVVQIDPKVITSNHF